jgi:nuclear pore complex protein Nup155
MVDSGLTYSQLVTSKVAQERIDTVLTNLFTDNSSFASFSSVHEVSSSVESNNLSSLLSNQCYLYFSIGSRLTHLGFSNAQSAMSQQPSTRNRVELTNSASSYLRQAATHWHNPLLICGQMDGSSSTESMTYEEMAVRAHESGSPLARAAFVLMELSDVVGLAEVCLICASNFGGVMFANESSQYSADRSGAMMTWEMGLYHRPTTGNSVDEANSQLLNSASSTAIIIGNSDTDTRKSDAQRTCHAVLFYYLNSLLKSAYEYQQNSELAAKMLSVATASTDINFLKELFGYLASSGHVDTLLKIDSPSVESWLENINKDPDLVWRYYVIHGMHWLAGEFMWKRGSVPEENLRIEERIQCLNRAANSYSDALTSSQNSMMTRNSTVPDRDEIKRIINQIREQIDVAELQSRVLSVITSSKNASQLDTQKMHILSSSLVNVSDLYNDYAAPLALYDLCLAIMQTCRCDDTATIITLWRSILCEELLPCRTGSKEVQIFMNSLQRGSMMEEETIILTDGAVTHEDGDSLMLFEDGEWISSVKHRVISLGKELQGKGADFVFPIEFIAEQLEGKYFYLFTILTTSLYPILNLTSISSHSTGLYCVHKCVSRKQAAPWTLQTLIEAGTSFPSLIEAYSSIVVAQEPDAPNPITK